jgi:peroxiredoxin Q/BCP
VATDGVVSTFSLQSTLKKGPVVVYFYPKAFTGGCSLEAHQFSEAIPAFDAKHVTVVGISTDEIGTLPKFSKEVCQGKLPVAFILSNSISYVIGTDGKIAFVHDSGDASTHVSTLLKAVNAGK